MKSIMALSMHKAGSTVANYIFVEFLKEKGYAVDEISKQVLGSPLPETQIYMDYQSKMSLEGTYYGMARSPGAHKMDILKDMRLILQVRDPRDCITSSYFSMAASHRLPDDPEKKKAFLEQRSKAAETKIDDYASAAVSGYVERLKILQEIVDSHGDFLLLKYEDMVEDTPKWLNDVATFVDQDITPALREQIKRFINFNVPNEDANRHKRQVKPGDHLRKLQPDTIAAMNAKFGDLLDTFGYAA